jgi:DNA-binding transcriptional ArsR family regulator
VAAIFEALGDATRRQLLERLSKGEQSVGSLVAALRANGAISQPAVSQHLKVLREAQLVTVRADGTRRVYAIDRDGLDRATEWLTVLAEAGDRLAQPLDALATEVARGRRARRTAATERRRGESPEPRDRPA